MYRDLWLLIYLYGLPVGRGSYLLIQALVGAGVAGLCWYRQRSGWSERSVLTTTLALVSAWMMLLGPSTESSSFALLAPSLAWSIVEALRAEHRSLRTGLLWGCCALCLAAVSLSGFTGTVRISELGVHSWASLLYLAYLLTEPRATEAVAVQRSGLAFSPP